MRIVSKALPSRVFSRRHAAEFGCRIDNMLISREGTNARAKLGFYDECEDRSLVLGANKPVNVSRCDNCSPNFFPCKSDTRKHPRVGHKIVPLLFKY